MQGTVEEEEGEEEVEIEEEMEEEVEEGELNGEIVTLSIWDSATCGYGECDTYKLSLNS